MVSTLCLAQQSVEDRAMILYYAAEKDFQAEDYYGCIDKLNQVEKLLGDTNSKVLELKIKAYYNNTQYSGAYTSKKLFFEKSNKSYNGYQNILRMVMDIEQKAYKHALDCGNTYYDKSDYKQAATYYIISYEIDTVSFDENFKLAYSYYEIERYEEAGFHFLKHLDKDPDNLSAYFNYMLCVKKTSQDPQLVDYAQSKIDEIQLYWEATRNSSLESCNDFVYKYPKSKHVAKVIELRDKLEEIERIKRLDKIVEKGFTDPRDNEHYKLVRVGNNIWMAENMRHEIGTHAQKKREWKKMAEYESVFCTVNDFELNTKPILGLLYNWEAANIVCPDGWHLPNSEETEELVDHINNQPEFWEKFSYYNLYGGYRDVKKWKYYDYAGYYWTTAHYSTPRFKARDLLVFSKYSDESISDLGFEYNGYCVRCVMDQLLEYGTPVYDLAVSLSQTIPVLNPDANSILISTTELNYTNTDFINDYYYYGGTAEYFQTWEKERLLEFVKDFAEDRAVSQILYERASEFPVSVAENEIDDIMQDYYDYIGSEDASVDFFRENTRKTLLVSKYLDMLLADLVKVTKGEIDSVITNSMIEIDRVRVQQILIGTAGKNKSEKTAAFNNIKALHKRALTGEDFVELARENTEDPGGIEYVFGKGEMVKPFEEVAFSIPVNQISDIFETRYGYHVIKVNQRITKELTPDQAKEILQKEKWETAYAELVRIIKNETNFVSRI